MNDAQISGTPKSTYGTYDAESSFVALRSGGKLSPRVVESSSTSSRAPFDACFGDRLKRTVMVVGVADDDGGANCGFS